MEGPLCNTVSFADCGILKQLALNLLLASAFPGRNIHALDPYRMPSPAAAARGAEAADKIIEQHRAQNEGAYPETVAVNLWGLDAIKTKGESVAIVLQLVGARTVKESTGRVARCVDLPGQFLTGKQ
eukprot:scaffold7706_cov350-Prasinococcus_capsulatus_cf.AAC.1